MLLCTISIGAWAQSLLPKVSTSEAPIYYRIVNQRCNKFATYAGDATKMTLSAEASDNNKVYFVDAGVNDLPEGVIAVKIFNVGANKFCAGTNSFTESGIVWYLKSNVYASSKASVAINKNATNWNSNSDGWNNYQGSGNFVDTWSSNDVGSTWTIEPCDWNGIEVTIKNWQHASYVGYSESSKKVEGSTTKPTNWTFETAGDGKYYLKSGDYYIGAMPGAHDTPCPVTTEESEAEKFTVGKYNNNAQYYTLQLTSGDTGCGSNHNYAHGTHWTGEALTVRGVEYAMVRWDAAGEASHWLFENPVLSVTQDQIDDLQSKINSAVMKISYSTIGYPKNEAATSVALAEYISVLETPGVTENNYYEALEAYNATLVEADINLPEAGKAYKMYFQCANSDKKYYIQSSGNPSENAETAAVVVLGDKGGQANAQRFYFVDNANGQFMNFQGFSDKAYTSECHDFKVVPVNIYGNTANNLTLPKEKSFGLVFLFATKRPNGSNNGGMVISESNGAWSATAAPFFNGTYTSGVVFEEVEDYTANVVVFNEAAEEDGKYVGTYYSTYAVTLPEGVEAYTATAGEESLSLTKVEGDVLPKATPVVLTYATAEEDVTLQPAAATPAAVTGNVLSGTAVEKDAEGSEYVLSVVNTEVGFYKFAGEKLAANKAYYVSNTPNVQGFVLNFGGEQTTGIESLIQKSEKGISFDLQGRRVNANVKGISIVNNKKVIK